MASGVKVGLGPDSTTKVPYLRTIEYQERNIRLMDLPGFFDANQMDEAMISIFLKYLLNTLAKARLILVISATKFSNLEFPAFRNEYYRFLFDLFGAHLAEYLPDIYFVITRMDEIPDPGYLDAQVDRLIRSVLNTQDQTTSFVSGLLNRVRDYSIRPDYRHDNREKTLGTFFAMFGGGETREKRINKDFVLEGNLIDCNGAKDLSVL
jgi:hypothetical protein